MSLDVIKHLVKTTEKLEYPEFSAYRLPPRFYIFDQGAIFPYNEDCETWITGANCYFCAETGENVKRHWLLNEDVNVDSESYYFLKGCNNYDLVFHCKSVDAETKTIQGYSKEEVETILKETGVTYQPIEDFFVE